MKFDMVVSGGRAVCGGKIVPLDIYIKNGKIAALEKASKKMRLLAAQEVEAGGKIILPGIIDAHVHFSLPVGKTVTCDSFESGSRAALCSGVTTIIDYTTQGAGEELSKALKARVAEAQGSCHCDFGIHCVIPSWKSLKNPAAQMKELVRLGSPTFKLFMIYEDRGMMADDGDIFAALESAKACGGMICVHAESERILKLLINRYNNKGLGAKAHALSRPDFTEWEAVQRAAVWAETTGGKLYIVHASAGRSAQVIADAKKRGVDIWGETCPQYLALDESVFSGKDGHLFTTCPQIKKKVDSVLLWQGLRNGDISVIATDSCSFDSKQKSVWGGDITKLPFGIPSVETSLPVVYTEGVASGRITLPQLVKAMCENPAKLHGLYPQKGVIAVGADADLAIIDPQAKRTVDWRTMNSKCDWNPYQGRQLKGFPTTVILRGKVAAKNGKLTEETPSGKFIRRKKPVSL